jgi:hypothetical protein
MSTPHQIFDITCISDKTIKSRIAKGLQNSLGISVS